MKEMDKLLLPQDKKRIDLGAEQWYDLVLWNTDEFEQGRIFHEKSKWVTRNDPPVGLNGGAREKESPGEEQL